MDEVPVDAGPEGNTSLDTRMQDLLAGLDLSWHLRGHTVRSGLQVDAYRIEHDMRVGREEFNPWSGSFHPFDEVRRDERPRTLAAYLEDEWRVTDALRLRAGVRALHAGGGAPHWMPRVGARLTVAPGLDLTLGGGRYAQVLRSARDEETVFASLLAYDLIAAVPPELGLSTADDAVIGAEWASGTSGVRVDAYTKRMRRLALRPSHRPQMGAMFVDDELEEGEGRASGVELFARHAGPRGSLWLTYQRASTERTVDGFTYPARFDRRHVLDLVGSLPAGDRSQLTGRLAAASGQPYTPALGVNHPLRYDHAWGRFRQMGFASNLLGEHNSERTGRYLRADVSARRDYERHWFGRPTVLTAYLQVVNVLNARNRLITVPRVGGDSHQEVHLPQLPFLPTFGVEWRF